MRVLCYVMFEYQPLCEAMAELADVELVEAVDEQQVLEQLPHCHGLITYASHYSEAVASAVNSAPQLRWLHFVTAGFDPLWQFPPPRDLSISSAGQAWAGSVAEHAIALLLALLRQLPRAEHDRGDAAWRRDALIEGLATLAGRRLVLLGFGDIGRGIARRLSGFEVEITALARTARSELGVAVHDLADLEELLPGADNVIVALPLLPDTHHLLNAATLDLLPPGARIVNVARGGLIEESALLDWLERGRGQAALDVFAAEPLPADHPYWTAPGLLITPHVAGFGDLRLPALLAAGCRDNLCDLLAGKPLRNAVDAAMFGGRT